MSWSAGHASEVAVRPAGWVGGARPFWVLLLLVGASRTWLLDSGFGSDPDAWQVANSGYWLDHAHLYILSRRPGYPLDEFVMAAFLRLDELVHGPGWLVPNILTTLVFAAQCLLFYRIARRAGARGALALVAAYALHPVVLDQSVGSLDIHLPLLLVLWAMDQLFSGRWLQAAVLFGFALPARVSVLPMLIPFLVWFGGNRSWRRGAAFAGIALAIAVPVYAPILWGYRSAIRPIPLNPNPLKAWISLGVFDTMGVDATIVLVVAAWTAAGALWISVLRRHDPLDRFLVLGLIVFVAVFMVKPYDGAYLVPAMPFLLLLLGRHARPRLVVAFLIVFVLNGLVSVPGLRRDTSGRAIGLASWAKGPMFERLAIRQINRRVLERIAQQAVPPRTVLVLGGQVPALWFHERHAILEGRRFEIVGGGMARFNKPLYERDRDVYYIPSWEVALAVELANRGYAVQPLIELPPRDMAPIRAALEQR